MYAIVRTCGKQFKVSEGDTIKVEALNGEAGEAVTLNEVLSLHDGEKVSIGRPLIKGASVQAEIVRQGRGKKIIIGFQSYSPEFF